MSDSNGKSARETLHHAAQREPLRITKNGQFTAIEFPTADLAQVAAGELTVSGLAKKYSLSYPVAVRELRRAGIKVGLRQRKRERIRVLDFSPEILARYQKGELTTQDIATLCGVSYFVAARELRRAGMTPHPTGRRCIVVEISPEILARYQKGELTTQDIATLCGVSYFVAAQELRRAGMTPHPRGPRHGQQNSVPEWYAEAVRCYEGGESLTVIAQRLGLTSEGVRYALKRCGVQLRSRGKRPKHA